MSTVMKFDLSRLSENVKAMTEIFLVHQGHECGEGGIAVYRLVPRSRILNAKYDGQVLKIAAEEDVHFYRALHLFLQEIENGTAIPFVREEKIYFRETRLLLDCSRNGAVKKSMLKEFIRLCACCGINQLYLYMEDLYEIPEEPYFGAFRDQYTCSDLQELDAYGRQTGVELIPAIQTLAHAISINIKLHRRELAMLRAIGMSDRDFKKMLNFECTFYGVKTLSDACKS